MFRSPDSLIVCLFVVFVFVLMLLYNYILMEKYKKNNKNKSSEILYRASNTDNGVPADEVFESLKGAGVEPKYLGTKEVNL